MIVNSPARTFVFAVDRFIDALKNSEFWHCDGTFNLVHLIFSHFFTIHFYDYKHCFICDRASYEEVFGIICGVADGYQPGSILMDFEMSMMNAARNIFPNSSIKGCFISFRPMYLEKNTAISMVLYRYKDETDFLP
ncbi:hypothetical protein RF11_08103 [Thelohanellus kitauei]|uniref:MULE transposase domain-containing protein n=1 Tax=Thelohanellus kitauei TaxID=669202 RepID=A0A0C2MQN0_THEKT|nr:hypothetical protein RF11_08103 [Thelohanellus kitauei]